MEQWRQVSLFMLGNGDPLLATMTDVTFSSDLSFLSVLSFPISIPFALSHTDYIGLLLSSSLSLITSIVNPLVYYLVADLLSPYQWLYSYLVQYVDPQSGVTVDLDYVPLPW